jgi:hypothetical protein
LLTAGKLPPKPSQAGAHHAQEDDTPTLHLVATFLLVDGSKHDGTFEMMQTEGAFSRLVDLVQRQDVQADMGLHQLLLKLLYEMSRIQKLSWDDLSGSAQ